MAAHDDLWTVDDIADHFGISENQVWTLIGRGSIPTPDVTEPTWRPSTIQGLNHMEISIPSKPDPEAEFWTAEDVAEYLEVSPSTVYSYRSTGRLPEADETVGRTPRWRPATIQQWDAQRPRKHGN